MKVKPIFESIAEHGEGPVWDSFEQKLYWVDLLKGIYFKAYISSNEVEEFSIGQSLGFLALRENKKGLVMGVRDGFGFYNEDEKEFNLIEPSPEQHNSEVRFNDGAVDPKGRFFGGTMEWNGAKNKGKLFRLNTDHSWDQLDINFDIPNGMGWNPERDTFYLVDSNHHAIYAYAYDEDSGDLSNKRIHIQFKENEIPDGMCIDSEGGFWIAMWKGSKVIHFDKNGNKMEEIVMPVLHPTSCCFGGKDMKSLFITTSKKALSNKQLEQYPLAGRLFKVETNTIGQIEPRYNG